MSFGCSLVQLLLDCALQYWKNMLTSRHISGHKLKQNLHLSLKKEMELNNRISVLMAEKEKRLRDIEKRVTLMHEEQELRAEKAIRRDEMERSFQQQRKEEQMNSHLAQSLRRDLSLGLSSKQAQLLQTKRNWYREMKKQSQGNLARINTSRQNELQAKQTSSKRVKLMQLHAKENVKQYWKERGEAIHQYRMKESEKNSQLFEHSLHNISMLEEKEQRLLKEIKETLSQQTETPHNILGELNTSNEPTSPILIS